MTSSIELDAVGRVYRGGRGAADVEALKGISLAVESGEYFGILGPNGAGKTTLVRILATLLTPTSGSARVGGNDVVRDADAVRRSIGVVFGGERGLYDRLSARDNLVFAADLYGVPRRRQRIIIPELLERVGLTDKATTRVETFSRGMKQRLHIARALVHEPQVILLDEPSSGLDPVAARSLRELTRELNGGGKTIVLTTHYMFEADELCDRLAIIADGEIVREGSPEQIKASVKLDRVLEVDVYGDPEPALAGIRALTGVTSVDTAEDEGRVRVTVRLLPGSALVLPDLIARFAGLTLGAAIDRGPTLEDAYVAIVGGAQ